MPQTPRVSVDKNVHAGRIFLCYLAIIRHEALYAAFILSKEKFQEDKILCRIDNLKDLPENIDIWNDCLDHAVDLNNKLYPYGICLFNKWCGFEYIIINKSLNKKQANMISEQIYLYHNKDTKKYYDMLAELERKLFFFISVTDHSPSLDVEDMVNLKDDESSRMLRNLPNRNITLGNHICEGLIDRCINHLNENSRLYKLFKSGSRFSKAQLSRSCIVIGYSADADNVVIPRPIKTSLLEGLTEEEFFMVSPGTRKSIKDKSRHTPSSGYLERTLVMALSMIEFDHDDCQTENHLDVLITSSSHAETLIGKFYRDPNSIDRSWKELDEVTSKSFINRKIEIRSPMTCENPGFKICKKCFGTKELKTKYVGIVAGQVLTERLTQLTLRTFHESGRAVLDTNPELVAFIRDHLIDLENMVDETDIEFTRLTFDSANFPPILWNLSNDTNNMIQEIISVDYENKQVVFSEDNREIRNKDVISIIEKVKAILRQGKVFTPPVEYYQELMSALLEVGNVYSSFVEILFTNMFLTDYDNKVFWRHNQHQNPTFKLGEKMMASYISPRQGLLYQPNKNTIEQIDLTDFDDDSDLSIHEKIWLGKV